MGKEAEQYIVLSFNFFYPDVFFIFKIIFIRIYSLYRGGFVVKIPIRLIS
jgi:hypothetical protein